MHQPIRYPKEETIEKDTLAVLRELFKRYRRKIHIVSHVVLLAPFLLVGLLLIITEKNNEVKNDIKLSLLSHAVLSDFTTASYPIFSLSDFQNLNVTAQAAIVLDDNSKVVLFTKNASYQFPMASTTKIMTALTALSYFKLDDVLTMGSDRVEGTVVGFKPSEKFFFKDLLYGMLLPSGNDAALAIAQNYPGGVSEFVKKMNENAQKFGLFHTHYSDSTGLDEGDYTNALELARLSSIALKSPTFAEVVSTKEKTISNTSGTSVYRVSNLNKLLGAKGVNGVKTGFTQEAGGVLVTSKVQEGKIIRNGISLSSYPTSETEKHLFIIVVMKSQDRFADTEILMKNLAGNIGFRNFY